MGRNLYFKRAERVGDLIKREVSEMLIRGIKDPRVGLVTITRVRLSDDLRLAKVFFSVMGSEEDRTRNLQGLNSAKGFIKREIGKRTHLRYVPDIVFKFDPSVEYADHLDRLIKEINREERTREEQ
ncbi:MAG: 30S ribosome-binding factor RbfA [Proteobacteria bacterium]|nr:30S ribosome-binding factor RbfA [Pseudomonadota bacterium]NIS71834.1 30S ribosome-binding factor RbfA [Pseudomonadota bacterium]